MHFKCLFKHNNRFYSLSRSTLFAVWIAALITGSAYAVFQQQYWSWNVTGSWFTPISVPTYLVINAVPWLLCLLFLNTKRYILVYILISCYAFCHSFCGTFLCFVFDSGAWLIRLFVLLPASVSSVLLWFRLLRNQKDDGGAYRSDLIVPAVIFCITCVLYFSVISPILCALADI